MTEVLERPPKSADNTLSLTHVERPALRVPNGYRLGAYRKIEQGDWYLRPGGYAAYLAGVHSPGFAFTLEPTAAERRNCEQHAATARNRLAAQ